MVFELFTPKTLGTFDSIWLACPEYVSWVGKQTPTIQVDLRYLHSLKLTVQAPEKWWERETIRLPFWKAYVQRRTVGYREGRTWEWFVSWNLRIRPAFRMGLKSPIIIWQYDCVPRDSCSYTHTLPRYVYLRLFPHPKRTVTTRMTTDIFEG